MLRSIIAIIPAIIGAIATFLKWILQRNKQPPVKDVLGEPEELSESEKAKAEADAAAEEKFGS